MRLELSGEERSRLAASGTNDPAAHLAYLEGHFVRRQEDAEGVRRAIESFEQAIQLDPSFAAAYAGLASVYNNAIGWSVMSPDEAVPNDDLDLQLVWLKMLEDEGVHESQIKIVSLGAAPSLPGLIAEPAMVAELATMYGAGLPCCFVDGDSIGDFKQLAAAADDGSLKRRLDAAGALDP